MNNDIIGYVPNLSSRISTMNATTLAGSSNSTRVEFYPCIASGFQQQFTAIYVNESFFKLGFSFYTMFFDKSSRRFSYLGMRINLSGWQSYFYINSSLITIQSYPDVVKNANFYIECLRVNNFTRIEFNPIYSQFDTTRSALSNDYEPIEI